MESTGKSIRYGAAAVRLRIIPVQMALFALSAIVSFLLRFDFVIPAGVRQDLEWALAVWVFGKTFVFVLSGGDRVSWRHVSMPDVSRVAMGNLAASLFGALLLLGFGPAGFPRSLFILDFVIALQLTAGARLIARSLSDLAAGGTRPGRPKRIVIYGAGAAGGLLIREIRSNTSLPFQVAGFVDDDPRKVGMMVHGATVLGRGSDLAKIKERSGVDEVFIAIPSAGGAEMTRILRQCHDAGLRCKTIPGLSDLIRGVGISKQIRDVAVEDLLGRTPAHLDESAIRASIAGKVILVTGAAGSIGSELCRQIARFFPRAIVGFEIAETPLFHLEREMKAAFPGIPFHAEIGDIRHERRLTEVFEKHRVSAVYHAAAYKHVPVMESNVFEAVGNNVLGTWTVANAAAKARVRQFVMISSDKAVRPANVMGVTKRVAELIVSSLHGEETRFVSVRFGNVLGSNGSVIPIFKEQIAAGGPVTVTHPDMHRYFMTIPEASQLVLQASAMSRGGEIFVLDMGKPIRIVDLATDLILLSGLRPGQDIEIQFSGVRPGEKLYEEINLADEATLTTYHEKIRIFAQAPMDADEIAGRVLMLAELCAARDIARLLLELKDLVPEYNPSRQLLESCFSRQLGALAASAGASLAAVS